MPQEDYRDLLPLIRAKVMETVNRLPRYMCTQTIDRIQNEPARSFKAPPCYALLRLKNAGELKLHPIQSGRLRFDVGVAGAGEIYSWAGENRFDDRNLLDLVHGGAISTGSFSAFLKMIFDVDTLQFTMRPGDSFSRDRPWRAQSSFFHLREKFVDGRTLVEFAFRIPAEESHYRFRNHRKELMTTAYDGTFLVDSKTLDLVRLTVQTSGIPIETGACEATNTLEYRRLSLNGAGFLLPVETRLQILNNNGTEDDNRTVYSGCHEFLGESTLKFDPPPDDGSLPSSETSSLLPLPLSPGLPFTLVLTQDIETSVAAAGDVVSAKLAGPIREHSRVLIPDGAAVRCRIVRIERFYSPSSSWKIVIKPETVESGGTTAPLLAAADRTPYTKAVGRLRSRMDLGTLRDVEDSASAVIELAGKNPTVKKGLKTVWVTTAPKPSR